MQLFLLWIIVQFVIPMISRACETYLDEKQSQKMAGTEEEMKKTSRKKILDKGICENEVVDYDELDY